MLRSLRTAQELAAFSLITLSVTLLKFRRAPKVVRPLIRRQIANAGVRLIPWVSLISAFTGFIVVGQMLSFFTQLGAGQYAGAVLVVVVVRELGPLATAMMVLARVGTVNVIELGAKRALGEVEALESLGIDPVHYLVTPRVLGLSVSIFCLTLYFILIALASAYTFVFFQDISLTPAAFAGQLADAMVWQDFLILTLKSFAFGSIIAVITCYEGLARPLRLEDISAASTRAVIKGILAPVALETLFLVYWII